MMRKIISCLLLKCMKTKAQGVYFADPQFQIEVEKTSSGFVDDITHFTNSFRRSLSDEDNIEDLATATSTTAQWWEALLFATGGKLELQKCFFYLMYWTFNEEGEARLLQKDEIVAPVTINDSETGEQVFIEQKDCGTPHKTLGVMETPSGDYKAEVKRLIEKSRAIAQRISSASINASEARTIYSSMYNPSITYSFAAGILSLKEAEKVQGAPIKALLTSMGYTPGMPHAIVYGPTESGGIGLRHLFSEQGTIKAMIMIQQIRANRSLGKTLQIQLRWAQRVAGLSTPLLETRANVPHLNEEKWLGTLREFLNLSELGLRVQDIGCPVMKRTGDVILMDAACTIGLSDGEIQKINRCRIHLRAES